MQVDPLHLEIHRIEFVLVGSNRAFQSAKKNAHAKTPNEISVSSDVDEISSMFMVIYS